jgi:hypothetical protein
MNRYKLSSNYNSNSNDILKIISNLIINKSFRWIILLALFILTILSYVQEPIRYSGYIAFTGLTYKLHYFILICITLFIYIFNFLSLELTIPFSTNLPTLWYIPIIIIIYAIILDVTSTSEIVTDKKGNLEPPPNYLLPKRYRLIIYYFIIMFDILSFVQSFIYSGITIQFKTTILHQFFLNRFGSYKPGNVLMFIVSWLGIIGLLLDGYMVRNQLLFTACNYGLPNSWDF